MEKNKIQVKVDYYFDWTYGVKISKLKNDLDELEKLGATDIEITTDCSYGSCSVKIEAIFERVETDEEFESRKATILKQIDLERERELRFLESLKKKYENI